VKSLGGILYALVISTLGPAGYSCFETLCGRRVSRRGCYVRDCGNTGGVGRVENRRWAAARPCVTPSKPPARRALPGTSRLPLAKPATIPSLAGWLHS